MTSLHLLTHASGTSQQVSACEAEMRLEIELTLTVRSLHCPQLATVNPTVPVQL